MSAPDDSPEGRHCPERVAELEQELGILGRYWDLWHGVREHGGYNDETGERA